jgi:hypothetical protein
MMNLLFLEKLMVVYSGVDTVIIREHCFLSRNSFGVTAFLRNDSAARVNMTMDIAVTSDRSRKTGNSGLSEGVLFF